jgi:hypothetical protein
LAVPGKAQDELFYVGLKHLDKPVFVSEQQSKNKTILISLAGKCILFRR